VLKGPAQHLEQDGGRPAEHQDAVHRGHRPIQPPRLHRRDIAVTERSVIDEGKIEQIGAVGRRTNDCIGQRPNDSLHRVRHHQDHSGRDHHGHQVQSRPRRVPQPRGTGNANRADDQRMDHNVDDTGDEADEELKRYSPLLLDGPAEG